MSNVQVIGFDIDSVRRYYNFADWPNSLAHINLRDRTVDVIPTPGHNETEISFYDRNTGLFFSGDFLLPERLLIEDANADRASAKRAAAFIKDLPLSYVLGGHIELNAAGEAFPGQSQYHPNEHALQMSKDDLLGLPAAVSSFNGSTPEVASLSSAIPCTISSPSPFFPHLCCLHWCWLWYAASGRPWVIGGLTLGARLHGFQT